MTAGLVADAIGLRIVGDSIVDCGLQTLAVGAAVTAAGNPGNIGRLSGQGCRR